MLKKLNLCRNKFLFQKKVYKKISDKKFKGYCCAVNINILVNCFRKPDYFKVVRNAVFNSCDGVNVKRIYNLTNKSKIRNYTGPDIFSDLAFNKEFSHFFIGGSDKVFNGLKSKIQETNSSNSFFYPTPFVEVEKFDYIKISKLINENNPDFIWVGLGAPKQEIFMSLLLPHIDRGLIIGVGAAFNFFSGEKKLRRAPLIFRKLSLEWLFRLFQEPKKILKRQVFNLFFIPLILINEIINFK